MEKFLLIGKIVKPQGILGEMKIFPSVDSFEQIKGVKTVVINDKEYTVLHWRGDSSALYFNLYGVADRNTAEKFRSQDVLADREQIKLPEGRVFVADIIGCSVLDENGKVYGKVKAITGTSVDVYVLQTDDDKEIMFAAADGVVSGVHPEKGEVIVNSARFGEVCVYED